VCRCERVSADTLRALVRERLPRSRTRSRCSPAPGSVLCGAHTCGPLHATASSAKRASQRRDHRRAAPSGRCSSRCSLGALAGATHEVPDEAESPLRRDRRRGRQHRDAGRSRPRRGRRARARARREATASARARTKRPSAGCARRHSDPSKIRLCRRSLEVFSTWREVRGDDIEWSTGGYVFPVYRPEDEDTPLRSLLAVAAGAGARHPVARRRGPADGRPGPGRDGLRGGTISPEDGHCSPLLALHAMFEHARRSRRRVPLRRARAGPARSTGPRDGVRTDRADYHALGGQLRRRLGGRSRRSAPRSAARSP
jgi:hypothetical protein